MFGDRDAYREREAKLAKPAGLDATLLGEGDLVMLSRCKATGDRSYIDTIWEIVAATPSHVAVKWSGYGPKPYFDDTKIIVVGEREFYDGRSMANALGKQAGEIA